MCILLTPLQTGITFCQESQKQKGQNGEHRPQDLCGFIILSDQIYIRLLLPSSASKLDPAQGANVATYGTVCYWVQNRDFPNLKSSVKAPHLNSVTGHTLPGKDMFPCFPAPSTEGRHTSYHLLKAYTEAGHSQLPALPWACRSGTNTPCSQMCSGSWLLGTCI